jgi:hypothetical protein
MKMFPISNILNRCQIFDQVKNPITGDYFQLETLKNAGAVPYDFTLPPGYENKKFPIITVNCIKACLLKPNREYLSLLIDAS